MKLRYQFVVQNVSGKPVAVAVGERTKTFNGMITLNGTAAFLWKALETEQTVESLVKGLLEEYDVEQEKAEADVKAFLAQLQKAGLLA